MKKPKKESLILGKMLQKIAPQIGASVLIEPEWGIAGMITFKGGAHSFFRYNTLDLNPVGASDIAKDKDYANFFIHHLGYPVVPESKTFFSKQWGEAIDKKHRTIDDAYAYAERIGLPIIVKPNSGSQGVGVALVHTKREFYRAMRLIFKGDRIALVQRYVQGKDYRLVVLDDRVISAYERIPLNITGTGRSTVLQLLIAKQQQFRKEGRDTQINSNDVRIANKLAHQGLSLNSVPKKGVQLFLLDNANLSTGGDSVDVTDSVHSAFREIAVKLTKDMRLRLCGVDLLVNGDITKEPKDYCILEINAAPGLDHYVKSGPRQEKIVEALYLEVLKSLDT
jgi:D-alanine-D-alanine ligase-like ATP-grasp enzyme